MIGRRHVYLWFLIEESVIVSDRAGTNSSMIVIEVFCIELSAGCYMWLSVLSL